MPSSPEEKAFHRTLSEMGIHPEQPASETPTPDHGPQASLVTFTVQREVVEDAIQEAVKSTLRSSPILREVVGAQLRQYATQLASESKAIEAMKNEVRDYLARYPALSSDPALQETVAVAIFKHIQG